MNKQNRSLSLLASALFALAAAGVSQAVAATQVTTKGLRLAQTKAGDAVTVRCTACDSVISAKVQSVSGRPVVATDSKGRAQEIRYICPACFAK